MTEFFTNVVIYTILFTGDSIIPANTSENYQGTEAPNGATFSMDGFYYVPQPNMTESFAEAAQCDAVGNPGTNVIDYNTDYDGIRSLSCVKATLRFIAAPRTARAWNHRSGHSM